MTPKAPVSFFLLGVLSAFVLVRASIDGDWWFVGAVVFASIHQVSIAWRNTTESKR